MTGPPQSEVAPDASGSRWARALGDGASSHEALRDLAAAYWYCVYAWWRRAGCDASQAATATLGAFARWLGDAPPTASDSGATRMREWLPLRLAELAQHGVRWEGRPVIEIDPARAERRYADEPAGSPDAVIQRRWAGTVIELTVFALRTEYSRRGEDALFEELLAFAGYAPGDGERYAAAGARVALSGDRMHKAVFDFRARQREVLRAFVADTVLDPAEVESEITALLCAFDLPGSDDAGAPLPTGIRGLRPDEVLARAMRSVRMTGAGFGDWQPPAVEEAARLFPQYEIRSLLGRGGMGAVYGARQIELDRLVAIKLLPLEVSVDRDFADRFRREARAMAKLSHPNIIAVHEFGATTEGHLFFVMEFVEGANLDQLIHGPAGGSSRNHAGASGVTPARALEIIGRVCDALAYAHAKGIVHRDIKPANVMVSVDGQVKVADFGLARLTDPDAEQLASTSSNCVMGTPDYMAPEQMRGMKVDHRADIYSLGVMLYEMLCREPPRGVFDPPSARLAGLDAQLDQVITKAMQQQPERRYQSTQEMKIDVVAASAFLSDGLIAATSRSRAPWVSIGVAATLVALGVAAILLRKPKAPPPSEPEVTPIAAVKSSPPLAHAPSGPNAAAQRPSSVAPPVSKAPSLKVPALVVPATASKEAPFVNTLGMKLVPVPIIGGATAGQRVLFSIWETRVEDFEIFARETKREWVKPDFPQGPAHPAVNVSWEDAQRFCQWLTAREQAAGRLPAKWRYRLPTDHEWSCTVELGAIEDASKPPAEKNGKIPNAYPWGTEWPPPATAGNYAREELRPELAGGKFGFIKDVVSGYNDGFVNTAPVGSFPANRFGLFDLGGNAWEWCEDWYDKDQKEHMLRGASWDSHTPRLLLSSGRHHLLSGSPYHGDCGFRVVLGLSAAAVTAPTAPPLPGHSTLAAATQAAPFVNTLGMKFVPVPIVGGPTAGQRVHFSVWETRVRDYEAFANEEKRDWPKPDFPQGPTHPAVNVSWDDAQLFCHWLTNRERAAGRLPAGWRYRLPTDHEWTCAVDLGAKEDAAKTPAEKSGKIPDAFPWGSSWPPAPRAGNYLGEEMRPLLSAGKHPNIKTVITGYKDGFAETAPVGSFTANRFGLFDLGGNAWEWCEDWFDQDRRERVLRGASWESRDAAHLLSSHRNRRVSGDRSSNAGFRCVIAVSTP